MTPTYFAGLFDGEGSLTIHKTLNKKNGRYYVKARLQLSMTHKDIVYAIAKVFGGSVHDVKRRTKSGLTVYYWHVECTAAKKALTALAKFCVVKKAQVALAVEAGQYLTQHGRKGRYAKITDADQAIRLDFVRRCKELNETL